MPRAGFELAIPATKLPQTYALDRAAAGICIFIINNIVKTAVQGTFAKTYSRECFEIICWKHALLCILLLLGEYRPLTNLTQTTLRYI
jgi:hypothetical protein